MENCDFLTVPWAAVEYLLLLSSFTFIISPMLFALFLSSVGLMRYFVELSQSPPRVCEAIDVCVNFARVLSLLAARLYSWLKDCEFTKFPLDIFRIPFSMCAASDRFFRLLRLCLWFLWPPRELLDSNKLLSDIARCRWWFAWCRWWFGRCCCWWSSSSSPRPITSTGSV